MKRLFRKYLRISLGALLIPVGVVGLILPVMPGWPFLILGLALLSTEWEPARRLYVGFEKKFPRVFRLGDQLKEQTLDVFRRSKSVWQVVAGFWGLARNFPTGDAAPPKPTVHPETIISPKQKPEEPVESGSAAKPSGGNPSEHSPTAS